MMLNKTARQNTPLIGFGPNHPQELANHKTFRAFLAVAKLLAGACSGGAGAMAPITPNSGSVVSSATRSMMRQSTVSSSAYGSAALAGSPAAYFRLDDSGTTVLDSNSYNMVMRSGVTKGSADLVAGDTAVTLPGISNAADVITSSGRNSPLEAANTVSVEVWIKPASLRIDEAVVVNGDDDSFAPYGLFEWLEDPKVGRAGLRS